MRCLLWSLILLGLGPAAARAQRLCPGYVVLANGDSLRGVVRLTSDFEQQQFVKFIPLAETKPIRLTDEQVLAYGYVRGPDTVRYRNCGPALAAGPVVPAPGRSAAAFFPISRLRLGSLLRVLQAGRVPYWWNFRPRAAEYFADCPGLAADLRAGRYPPRTLPAVAQHYNAWYGQHH